MPVGILGHGRRRPRPGASPRARAVALDWGIFSQHFRGEFTQQLQRYPQHVSGYTFAPLAAYVWIPTMSAACSEAKSATDSDVMSAGHSD
jgi:hypothetical protein